MLSPSPTQQPPAPASEKKEVARTPLKPRMGETPQALFVKSFFRPIFKGIYYLLQGIRKHKLVTLVFILILLASSTVATYLTTGSLPLGIGNDPFNFHIRGGNGGGDAVKNWLYAVRDGDAAAVTLNQRFVQQPPDPNQLINQFSQAKAHLTWKSINVIGVYSESDATIDSFVEVDLSATGPGVSVSGILVWHFTTVQAQGGVIINVSLVDFRAPL
jgi:hypothetical protein